MCAAIRERDGKGVVGVGVVERVRAWRSPAKRKNAAGGCEGMGRDTFLLQQNTKAVVFSVLLWERSDQPRTASQVREVGRESRLVRPCVKSPILHRAISLPDASDLSDFHQIGGDRPRVGLGMERPGRDTRRRKGAARVQPRKGGKAQNAFSGGAVAEDAEEKPE